MVSLTMWCLYANLNIYSFLSSYLIVAEECLFQVSVIELQGIHDTGEILEGSYLCKTL